LHFVISGLGVFNTSRSPFARLWEQPALRQQGSLLPNLKERWVGPGVPCPRRAAPRRGQTQTTVWRLPKGISSPPPVNEYLSSLWRT